MIIISAIGKESAGEVRCRRGARWRTEAPPLLQVHQLQEAGEETDPAPLPTNPGKQYLHINT